MKSRKELAEIAIILRNNLDEAEQFDFHVDELIRRCDRKYLLYMIEDMAESVRTNIEHGSHCVVEDMDILEPLLLEVEKVVEKERERSLK